MVDSDALEAPAGLLVPHILPIITWPDERLNIICENITTFDRWVEQLALDMFATMQAEAGVGLAAPQVGILANIITIQLTADDPQIFINPKIISQSEDRFEWKEGCLSVPGYFENRRRPNSIIIQYHDIVGEEHEGQFVGLDAFAIQHEIDHLNGKVFVDGMSSFKTKRVKDKISKTLKKRK